MDVTTGPTRPAQEGAVQAGLVQEGAAQAGLVHAVLGSPVGPVVVAVEDGAVTHLRLPRTDGTPAADDVGERVDPGDDPVLAEAVRQLAAYFAGELRDFDLPLRYAGTAFQRKVWDGLRRVPYGTTTSYGALAESVGLDPRTTARAVGAANGANRMAIVVPCHRVIGAGGKLVGFAAGLDRKRTLLDLERRVVGGPALLF
ncbi:methylated-DNA--[protein]-cysteine S-methyltransferase [Cellulomonas telluris]|uniref:methylated-DNA--[protein]-cysteine S-methyltransferase n=1 Tax=Cellulomonas telluris TaxID=2306636 RepID=UPI0027955D8A|nr:methylated-DNA--[protein]-cysteine S-methyltransferase [Cellulomonas telluris]